MIEDGNQGEDDNPAEGEEDIFARMFRDSVDSSDKQKEGGEWPPKSEDDWNDFFLTWKKRYLRGLKAKSDKGHLNRDEATAFAGIAVSLARKVFDRTRKEQTPLATASLASLLAEYGVTLELPVAELRSREHAMEELIALGLSPDSLEQKCSRQVTNLALDESRLRNQISLWGTAIRRSMNELDRIPAAIIEDTTIAAFARMDK